MNEYQVGTTIVCDGTFRDQNDVLYDPTEVTAFVEKPDGVIDTIPPGNIVHPSSGYYYFHYTPDIEGEYMYQFTGTTGDISSVEADFFIAVYYVHTDLDYLITDLRFHLGDTDERKYSTDYLRQGLIMAIKTLMRRWRFRYLYSDGVISRNPNITYQVASPPVIQHSDERIVVLQAGIIIKSANIQDSAWDIGSWKDGEISYSNIAGAGALRDILGADRTELEARLRRPLYGSCRQSLEDPLY